jgi:hypothetical protein
MQPNFGALVVPLSATRQATVVASFVAPVEVWGNGQVGTRCRVVAVTFMSALVGGIALMCALTK